jgi:hypothetical protein
VTAATDCVDFCGKFRILIFPGFIGRFWHFYFNFSFNHSSVNSSNSLQNELIIQTSVPDKFTHAKHLPDFVDPRQVSNFRQLHFGGRIQYLELDLAILWRDKDEQHGIGNPTIGVAHFVAVNDIPRLMAGQLVLQLLERHIVNFFIDNNQLLLAVDFQNQCTIVGALFEAEFLNFIFGTDIDITNLLAHFLQKRETKDESFPWR